MDNLQTVVAKEEAEEFGEYQKMKRALKIRESVASLEINACEKGLTFSFVKELCEQAKRLGVASLRTYPVLLPVAKKYLRESKVKLCCVIEGEHEGKTLLFAARRALKEGADELEVHFSSVYWKNDRAGVIKRTLKKIVKRAKEKKVCAAMDTQTLSFAEKKSFFTLALRCGASSLLHPFSLAELEKLKEDGVLPVKSFAENAEEFFLCDALGVSLIVTSAAEQIAKRLFFGEEGENEKNVF